MVKIILATSNTGKIREFESMVAHLPIQFVLQSSLNIPDANETGLSFVENALIKARHAAKLSGMPAIADDSGLVVKSLEGAPGIYSARYAGEKATAQDNINKLLTAMAAVPEQQRQAYFYCVIVYLTHEQDPTPLICEGQWHGNILTTPHGQEGFGYDPIFFVPTENKSAAELAPHRKNIISHRGQALHKMLGLLKEQYASTLC